MSTINNNDIPIIEELKGGKYQTLNQNNGKNNMPFLPKDYKLTPSTSNYFRFEDGENNIRILSDAITGWEYFTKDNKPVRSQEGFEDFPSDIKDGGKVKEFWAFIIWNYNLEKLQIMELTQKTIMGAIMALEENPKWGCIKDYDLTVVKKGQSLDTEYNVIPNPHTELPEVAQKQFENSNINLDLLYDGKSPFGEN